MVHSQSSHLEDPMNSFWNGRYCIPVCIVSPVLLAWIIETGVSRLGAIIVVGSRSLYRSEEENDRVLRQAVRGDNSCERTGAAGRGLDVRALKEPDAEEGVIR